MIGLSASAFRHSLRNCARVAAPGGACAHGEASHGKPSGPVIREQKPWGIAGDAKAVSRTIEVTMSVTPSSDEDAPLAADRPPC
jgi:hypothetical protein